MSTVELQAAAMVQEIERQAASQRRALLAAATREAQAIAERAHEKVRRQQQRAIEDLRQSERDRTRQLRATLDTTARRQAAAAAKEMLEQAWPHWAEALARRWATPDGRAAWVAALLAQAAARLPLRDWVVRHPVDWVETDAQTLQAALKQHGVQTPTLQADPSFDAGLVIEVDGARLDGTPAALLCDRTRIEAALLAALRPANRASPAAAGKGKP
jgi:vacuolar-type H+-ATPase subunit E/Vma4